MGLSTKEKTYFLTLKQVCTDSLLELKMEVFSEELSALQKQVGGTIEHFYIDEELTNNHIDMWIDDEGKLKNLKPTMLLYHDGRLVDYISGPCVFTRYDSDGITYGLRDEDMEKVRQFLYRCPTAHYETRDHQKGFALVVGV